MDQTRSYAKNQTVVGYFENREQAELGLQALRDAGFTSAHVGVAHGSYSRESESSKAKQTGHGVWEKIKEFFEGSPENYADERTRGDLGTREVTNPDQSSYSGYSHDELYNSLSGMSIPEYRSRYFSSRLRTNPDAAIVTVNVDGRASEAERILREFGADLGETATETNQYAEAKQSTGEDTRNIQLLGEVLRVHKDRINRGEAVIRKEVVADTQTVQVPVTREELVVERRPVSGEAQARGKVGEEREIRIPLTEETASVDKDTVVREEVAVGKKPVREVRDLSDEVRREELVVEDKTTGDQQRKRVS